VIGRFGNVAVETLKNSDVLSRQHLRVDLNENGWVITLLPNARNTTRIDSRVMTPGQSIRLGPVHDIVIHELQFRLRQREAVSHAPLLEDFPTPLLKLDVLLQIENFNFAAGRLLSTASLHGVDFTTLLSPQSAVTIKVALGTLQSGESSSALEIKFAQNEQQSFKLTATNASDRGYLVSFIEVATEKQHESQTTQSETGLMSDAIALFLNSSATRQGDLAACLPSLVQLGFSLLPDAAITLWLSDRNGLLQPSACAGSIPAVDQSPIDRELFPPQVQNSHPLSYLHEDGALLVRLTSSHEPTAAQKAYADLINGLFSQTLHLSRLYRALEKLNNKEEAQKIELTQAKRYISRLLPAPVGDGRVQVQYHYEPCSDLGGDLFGYQWITADCFCLYLVDVAGHGIAASLLAVSIVNHLRLSLERHEPWLQDPALWLKELNSTFQMEKHSGLTWTIWCGVYFSGKRELIYASGGHPPALLMDRGKVKELSTQGPVMGALPDIVFQSARIKLTEKAKLLLYTDGVYEFPLADGSTQTFEAYLQSASSTLSMTDGECRYLYNHAAAQCYGAEFPDDFTLLCVRFL